MRRRNWIKECYTKEKRQMPEMDMGVAPRLPHHRDRAQTQQANLRTDLCLDSVKQCTEYLLKDLDRGKVRIGAGAGIDYLDIRVYPVNDHGHPSVPLAAVLAAVGPLWLASCR